MLGWIMDIDSRKPRSPRNSGARRNLFGSSTSSRRERHGIYEKAMEAVFEMNKQKWDYDFVQEAPVAGGNYEWKCIVRTPEKKIKNILKVKAPRKKTPVKIHLDRNLSSKTVLRLSERKNTSSNSPAKRKRLADLKTDVNSNSLSYAGGKSPRGFIWDSENVCPLQRVRESGVVKNLAALYWSDNNNNNFIPLCRSPVGGNIENSENISLRDNCGNIGKTFSGNVTCSASKAPRLSCKTDERRRRQSHITGEVMIITASTKHALFYITFNINAQT